jgi:carbamoyltransferase
MTTILGINFFSHDTAACLLVDGKPVAVVEEERLNREQHTKQFPTGAIDSCLEAGGASIQDVDAIAVAQRPFVDLGRGAGDAVARVAPKRLAAQVYTDARLMTRVRHLRKNWGYRGPVHSVGHHDAHAAGAFFASPFDEAAVLTVDRGGDFLSTTMWTGEGHRLRPVAAIRNPHSLGEVYTAVTSHLGFRPGADEGKVMGLAPYGSARLVPIVRDTVRLLPDGTFEIDLRWFGWQREGKPVGRRFVEAFGPARVPESDITEAHKDLAYAVQAVLEEAALHVGRHLQRKLPASRLCLSGGVALNSVMNRILLTDAGFSDVWIQPAASDAGNALGAALWVWHAMMDRPREWVMDHAHLGRSFTDEEIQRSLASTGIPFRQVDDCASETARLVADGKVVGWFQGRAEIGPRALGSRSILADARRPDMQDIVNHQVKRREWFRPFAPSVLAEHADPYFVDYYPNAFMLLVQPVRPERRHEVPAITHVDGTARLQTVTEHANPLFHRLLTEFRRLTGVPMVLNTSFNLRGEPIVHRPEEAIADYLRSGMDALVMGNCLAEKRQSEPAAPPPLAGAAENV